MTKLTKLAEQSAPKFVSSTRIYLFNLFFSGSDAKKELGMYRNDYEMYARMVQRLVHQPSLHVTSWYKIAVFFQHRFNQLFLLFLADI